MFKRNLGGPGLVKYYSRKALETSKSCVAICTIKEPGGLQSHPTLIFKREKELI